MCLSGGDNVVAINETTSLLPFALTDWITKLNWLPASRFLIINNGDALVVFVCNWLDDEW